MNAELNVAVSTLQEWLTNEKEVYVLDIRPKWQREEWRIPGSAHFDAYDKLKENDPTALDELELPTDVPVVTVCGAGNTSLIAASKLREKGVEAYSLEKGMKGWTVAWNTAEIDLDEDDIRIIQIRRTGKGCLSYIIASQGEATVIDASLDPEVYIQIASEFRFKIKYVLDTHIHADHLSRTKKLADISGAQIFLPTQNKLSYSFNHLHDDDVLDFGKAKLRVIHTPGHTDESSSYLLNEKVLFTGDTLFANGVGRPDLKADGKEAYTRAKLLYQSLQNILALSGETIILAGHTGEPVPFDKKPIYSYMKDTIENVGMLKLSEEQFVLAILTKIPPTPPNYEKIVSLNLTGDFDSSQSDDLEAGANRCAIS